MDDNESNHLELLHKLFTDNKVLTKEFKIQLDVVEKLEKENKALTADLRNIQREASLYKERDDLNVRRNAALARENRLLKERCGEIATEKKKMQVSLQDKIMSMQASYEEQLEQVGWNNDRLGIDITVKETKLQKLQKDCKLLVQKNKRIRKIMQNSNAIEKQY